MTSINSFFFLIAQNVKHQIHHEVKAFFIQKPFVIMTIDQSYVSDENDSIWERDIHGVCSK